MFSEQEQQQITGVARTLQIIVAAMAAGVLGFGAYAISAAPEQGGAPQIVSYAAIGAALVALAMQTFLPKLVAQAGLKGIAQRSTGQADRVEAITQLFVTKSIVGLALLEGAAFFNLAAYMIEGYGPSLAFATAMLVTKFFYFPTTPIVSDWVERQLRDMQ